MKNKLLAAVTWTFVVLLLSGCTKSAKLAAPQWFADVTEGSRLQFVHQSGASGKYLMTEQIGSGAALFDYDNDGRLDVYLIQNGGRATNQLFHQEPNGTFRNVSPGSGLDVTGLGMGAACGDVNNDGRVDLLVTEYGRIRLFLNLGGGRFTNGVSLDNPRWATSAAFFDYDLDGWLDLVVANYLDFDPTHECYDAQGRPEYCAPTDVPGTATRLFHNRGGKTFEDVTLTSGLAQYPGPGLGVVCADFNGDHRPDILIADDERPNRLFINRGDGTFAEEAAMRGIGHDALGRPAANMGIGVGDVNSDGLLDIFITHLTDEMHTVWLQGPAGLFQDRTAVAGLGKSSWRGTGFGAVMADFDNDGHADLAAVNGRIKRNTSHITAATTNATEPFWYGYLERNQMFANTGGGTFRDISTANSAFCSSANVGRGLACGDIDNDGAVDLLVTSISGSVRLYRNIAGKHGHWAIIRAIDPALGGRDAYGAQVTIHSGNWKATGWINPGYSYLCSNDPRAHFGLGARTQIDRTEITWPDGKREQFAATPCDRIVVLEKGKGK
ncbi:MAG TPA: CRTAC1 family protein [Verrucomicrobiae bacterium]|nr:CRTAC1 family protein [Verrucomicrobiae bacterium]